MYNTSNQTTTLVQFRISAPSYIILYRVLKSNCTGKSRILNLDLRRYGTLTGFRNKFKEGEAKLAMGGGGGQGREEDDEKYKADRVGKTQKVEKEQRWRKGGAEGEHKHEDIARKQKGKQKKATVEDRKEMTMNRSTRTEKEKRRSRSTRRGVVR